jgi:isoleucyl-tRNA synthetase
VHLAPFPAAGGARDEALEVAMDAVRRLASLARAAREEARLRVRQPLRRMQVAVPAAARGPAFDELLSLLRAEVNVREVEVVLSDTSLVRLRAKANFRSLGRRFGKRTPEIATACAALTPEALRALEGGHAVQLQAGGETVEILPEDVVVEREVTSDWIVQSDGPLVVALDPSLDNELRAEGIARELVNRVQRVRKDAGYEFTTRIALSIDGDARLLEAARTHAGFIRDETLARALHVGARAAAADLEQEAEVEGMQVVLGVERSDDGRPPAAP